MDALGTRQRSSFGKEGFTIKLKKYMLGAICRKKGRVLHYL